MRRGLLACLILMALVASACARAATRADALRREKLPAPCERLKRMARPLGAPATGDWLASHRESGQSFQEFLRARPLRFARPGDTIVVVPIGDFTPGQWRILEATVDYLERFFDAPVRLLATVPRSAVPESAFRFRQDIGSTQLSTRFVLDRLLPAKRHAGAMATIALTAIDLFPQQSWNFVFGQASAANRSGVWSMFRFGDPDESPEAARRCLLRTIKTASHEIGHMLPIHHCIAYECLMNGSNHLAELDERPSDLCPSCLAKLMWCAGSDPLRRAQRLVEFHAAHRLGDSEQAGRRALSLLDEAPRAR